MTTAANGNPLALWFESRSNFLYLSFIIVAVAIITVSCLRNPADFDGWWHLKMGQDFVENGLSPFVDHYSFTFFEAPISQPPILFQAGYFYLTEWFGERGGQVVFKLAAYLGLLLLFTLWLRQLGAPLWVRFLIISLLITAVQARMQVRPELISYSLTVIAFMLSREASKDFSWRTLLPIAALLLFWVNYHNPLFGYVVIFGLFVDVALRQLRERADVKSWLLWSAWGLLLVSLGFLRPDGEHFLMAWLAFSPEWRENITEYFVPTAYLAHPPTYLWMLAAAAASLLSLAQKRWGYVVVLLVFLYGAFSMGRMVVPSLIVVLCILADVLSDTRLRGESPGTKPLIYKALVAGGSLVAVASLALGFHGAQLFLKENRSRLPNVPVATLNYMQQQGIEGRIFNLYKLGGYILYRMGPKMSVYIDGRTDILYPIEHFLRYNTALENKDDFMAEVEKYDIAYALLPNTDAASRMMQQSNFMLEYSDSEFSLYRRGDGRFKLLGSLTAEPYCTEMINEERFSAEVMDGFALNTKLAYLNPLLVLANNYQTAADKQELLAAIGFEQLRHNPSKRLFAALAMQHGLYAQGAAILNQLDHMIPRDALAAVLMSIRSGNNDVAIQNLTAALANFRQWRFVDDRDLEILYVMLRELDPNGDRNLLPPDARAQLDAAIELPASIMGIEDIAPEHFCSESAWVETFAPIDPIP